MWGGDGRDQYREFKIKQLGQERFDALMLRANSTGKKDEKLSYLIAKQMYEDLKKKRNATNRTN